MHCKLSKQCLPNMAWIYTNVDPHQCLLIASTPHYVTLTHTQILSTLQNHIDQVLAAGGDPSKY
jgi:hypothetical protein